VRGNVVSAPERFAALTAKHRAVEQAHGLAGARSCRRTVEQARERAISARSARGHR